MPGIGIIANPHSKLNKRSPEELKLLQDVLGQKGIFSLSQDLAHLDRIIHEYKEKNIDIIGINGGDGSISRAISRIISIYGKDPLPQLCVLGGGTMNLVASQLGVRGSPHEVLRRLLEAVERPESLRHQKLATLKIGEIYGFLYADQSSTAILEEFYQKKNGHVGATWLSVRLINSFLLRGPLIKRVIRSHRLEATFKPGGRLRSTALGSFAGTITKFPMGLQFLPLARERSGHFQVTVVTCPPEKLLWYMPAIMLQQKEGPASGKHSFCCEQANLRYEGSVHFTVDGEIYVNPTGSLKIEAGPELEFVCS
jgi:diacylglycerol kinase family enzyme